MANTNKKEEITDILTAAGIQSGEFKVGQLLKFADGTNIKITKIDKKNGKAWGEHIQLVSAQTAHSHKGHQVDGGRPGSLPFCEDCQVFIDEPSTEDGEKKALDRKDAEDEELKSMVVG